MARWDPHPETPEMTPSPTKGGDDNMNQDDNANTGLDDYDMGNYEMDDFSMDDYDANHYNMNEDNTDDNQKDYIVLEFARNGDLKDLIAKLHEAGGRIPRRVLWSWWICCKCAIQEASSKSKSSQAHEFIDYFHSDQSMCRYGLSPKEVPPEPYGCQRRGPG